MQREARRQRRVLDVEAIVGLHDEESLASEESPQRCDGCLCLRLVQRLVMANPRMRGAVDGQPQHQSEGNQAERHGGGDAVRGAPHALLSFTQVRGTKN